MITKKLPLVIDCDLIRELRRSGRTREATKLLKAFREDVEKTKFQVRNDFKRKDWRIKKFKGICPDCNNKAEPGKTMCKSCAKKRREYEHERRKVLILKGLCINCGKKAEPSKSKCQECSDRDGNYNYNRYYVRKFLGHCISCNNKAEPGKTMCKSCAKKKREYDQERKRAKT